MYGHGIITICRQCRLPKGARKPVVGPVACYRGVARTISEYASLAVRNQARVADCGKSLFARFYRGRVDRVASEGARFLQSAAAGGGTDGYGSYIKSARERAILKWGPSPCCMRGRMGTFHFPVV
ncbi:hypothetical protein D1006_23540 [Burkholderia stabilis]|uniref:Uncharacterized protein n=1 Tax=Burkholderia stabilis TaxID=95485 RepID=A0A4Q2AF70_9BURK|nr:hypothetical protein D1006_23540 [Burkholderia stabilis]